MSGITDRMRECYDAVQKHGSLSAAAAALGVARQVLRRAYRKAVARGMEELPLGGETSWQPCVVEPAAEPASLADRRERDQIAKLRAQLTAAQRESIEAEDVRAEIFKLARTPANPPEWLRRSSERGRKSVTGVPVVMFADWHIGETVNPAEVNGVNEFNIEVAERRIRTLVDRTIELCTQHMTNPDYDGIVVCLMGDLVTGEIHDELAQTNDMDLLPAALWTRDILISALTRLADVFGKVFVPAVPGNHGRTTKRVQAKRFAAKNIDWLVYILLEKYFAEMGDDRVQIYAPETGEALFRIYSHRFLCLHGHDLGVKGGDGILGALGPIARGAMKVANSQSQIGRDFDMLLLGHWHQSLQLPRVIVANSLKGYDEFARSFLRAGFSVPSQPLFFVHPKHGITARWEILLEEREIAAEREWISWKAA